jgi:hypothetical protein
MTSRSLCRIASVLCVMAFVGICGLRGPLAQAQTTTADIVGTVTDPTGAVIPNAQVTVRNEATGEIRGMNTTSTGEYVFTALQVGRYSISVTAKNFETFKVSSVVVAAGDRARVDAKMHPGAENQSITVTGVAPALQTDTSSDGDMLGTQSVQDLPLNGRNFINLLQVTAGVNAGQPSSLQSGNRNSDQRPTGSYSANGMDDEFNNDMIDGLDNNAGGFLAVRPSIEDIDEIKILTNNYSADLGRAAGAVVNVVTKAGTNEIHGSAYEYLRNDFSSARNYFAQTGRVPELRWNQFGGSIGGPIFRNKTFFFGDAEELRYIAGNTALYTVPTAAEMATPGYFGDLTDPNTGKPGPTLPTVALNKIGLAYYETFPATGQIPGLFANNYQGTTQKQQYATTVDGRIDHHFTPNDLLFVRYAYNPYWTMNGSPFPPATINGTSGTISGVESGGTLNGISGKNINTTQNAEVDYTHIFKPTLLLEARAGYTRYDEQATPLNYGRNIPSQIGQQNVNLPGVPGTSGMPNLYLLGYSQLGDVAFEPIFVTDNVLQANGAVTYIRGNHTLKLGGALIHREASQFQSEFGTGLIVFSGLYIPSYGLDYPWATETLLLGIVGETLRANQLTAMEYEYWEPSAYAQDDWRATRNLTLNLGIRYEVFPPNIEKRNRSSNFDLSTLSMVLASSGDQHLGVKTPYADFSPRVGFALSLPRQTAVHGGFGMTFYPLTEGVGDGIGSSNPPSTFSNTALGSGFTSMVVPTAPNVATLASNSSISSVNSWTHNYSPMYVEQFSVDVQKQFGANVATVGYVGELGRQLPYSYNADEPAPPGAETLSSVKIPAYVYASQYPYLTTITVNNNAATLSYNALKVQIQRRTANGLTVNGNYTYARGLNNTFSSGSSNGSGVTNGFYSNNVAYDYGNSNLDVRHRVAASINYEIPFGKNLNGAEGVVLKGWQANTIGYWQTGLPFTVVDGATAYATPSGTTYTQDLLPSGAAVDRPNMLHGAHASNSSVNQAFDISAFQLQTLGTAGDEHRNQIYGPHDRRLDLSIFKTFKITERVSTQFRAECFDLFNTPNFATPNNSVTAWNSNGTPNTTTTNFGTISSTAANEVQRQLQFALKATF